MLMEKSHERAITSTICIVVVAVVGNIPYFFLFVFRLVRAVVRVCIRLFSAQLTPMYTNTHIKFVSPSNKQTHNVDEKETQLYSRTELEVIAYILIMFIRFFHIYP